MKIKNFALVAVVIPLFFYKRYDKNTENNVYYNSAHSKDVKKIVGKIYHDYFDYSKMPRFMSNFQDGDASLEEFCDIHGDQAGELIDIYLEHSKDSLNSNSMLRIFLERQQGKIKTASLSLAKNRLSYRVIHFHLFYSS